MAFNVGENVFIESYKIYNRSEKEAADDIKSIADWLETQPHLPEILGKNKIKNFLLMNKFSIEKAKQKIDMYYTIRSRIPDWFEDSNPKLPHFEDLKKTNILAPYPKLFDNKSRVFYMSTTKPGEFKMYDYLRLFINTFELRLEEDCMLGEIIIFDYANISFEDLASITPTLIAKYIAIYKKVYSLNVKAVYYINSPSYISTFLSLWKLVLKPKIFQRIHVCTDTSILKEVFSDDMLPKDYGGSGPSIQEMINMLDEKFIEYGNRFDELDTLRVDEKLRPEKLENHDFLGFYGNFKQLRVD